MVKKKDERLEAFDAAYSAFLVAVQGPFEEMQRQAMETQFNYSRAMQEASMHPNAANLAAQVHREHLAATTNMAKDVDLEGTIEAAYHTYLEASQEAWSATDLGAMNAAALAAVGNQALSVCSWVTWGTQQAKATAASNK